MGNHFEERGADDAKVALLLELDDGQVPTCGWHDDAVLVLGVLGELGLELALPCHLVKVGTAADDAHDVIGVEVVVLALVLFAFVLVLVLHYLHAGREGGRRE